MHAFEISRTKLQRTPNCTSFTAVRVKLSEYMSRVDHFLLQTLKKGKTQEFMDLRPLTAKPRALFSSETALVKKNWGFTMLKVDTCNLQ